MSGPISNIYVPNEGNPNSKLWIVGEAPGFEEEQQRKPFVGPSGQMLETVLSRAGLSREDVFLANLCHYRPAGNKFQLLLGSHHLSQGLDELDDLIKKHKPNVIAALGNYPMQYLTGKEGITKYRGAILSHYKYDTKVIPTFHPAYVIRNHSVYPIFDVDVSKIVNDSKFPELNLPEYEVIIDPPELDYWLERILSLEYITCDIENVKDRPDLILCCGFALSDNLSVVLSDPLDSLSKRYFLESVLSGPVRKVFHYGTHDVTCFHLNGFEVNNYTDDTIIQAHVLCPELPRDLEFLASVETRQPPWKEGRHHIPGDIKSWGVKSDKEELYKYNGKDCCVTYKIFESQLNQLKDNDQYDYYRYRMELQQACLEIGDSGLLVDPERRSLIGDHIKKERAIFTLLFYKLTNSRINVGSNQQLWKLLYEDMKLPTRTKPKLDKETGEKSPGLTADENAIVSLITFCKGKVEDSKRASTIQEWSMKLEALNLLLKIREYDKLISSYIDVPLYADGRARSVYKAMGAETGRLSNVKYVDGSGFNVQTAPRFSLKI